MEKSEENKFKELEEESNTIIYLLGQIFSKVESIETKVSEIDRVVEEHTRKLKFLNKRIEAQLKLLGQMNFQYYSGLKETSI